MPAEKVEKSAWVAWSAAFLVVHLYMGGYRSPLGSTADYLAHFVPAHAGPAYTKYLMLARLAAAGTVYVRSARSVGRS